MEKPLCRLCRHRHLSSEPHVFADAELPEPSAMTPAQAMDELVQQERVDLAEIERAMRALERHREQSREGMRRLRAKRKTTP